MEQDADPGPLRCSCWQTNWILCFAEALRSGTLVPLETSCRMHVVADEARWKTNFFARSYSLLSTLKWFSSYSDLWSKLLRNCKKHPQFGRKVWNGLHNRFPPPQKRKQRRRSIVFQLLQGSSFRPCLHHVCIARFFLRCRPGHRYTKAEAPDVFFAAYVQKEMVITGCCSDSVVLLKRELCKLMISIDWEVGSWLGLFTLMQLGSIWALHVLYKLIRNLN